MIELLVKGQAVDVAPNTKIMLNFASNIFGDISKITPSNSLTITLPKTPKNKRIFGMAMNTNTPYRRWEAELYINGIAVVDTAYLVMLSVSDSYEVALYWGVVTALQNLKDSDKTLADINEVLEIKYGGDKWWENWNTKYGKDENGTTNSGLLNASYSVGDIDLVNDTTARTQAALLPSVRTSWVWNNIVKDNSIDIEVPATFRTALGKLALPFTTYKTSGVFKANYIAQRYSFVRSGSEAIMLFYGGENKTNASYEVLPKFAKIPLDGRNYEGSTVGVKANIEGRIYCNASISLYAGTIVDGADICLAHYSQDGKMREEYRTNVAGANSTKKGNVSCDVFAEVGDYIAFYVRLRKQTGFDKDVADRSYINEFTFKVECEVDGVTDQVMGGVINTRDNLPAIKQLDFIKVLCAMYGLWATLVNGVVHLVRYSDLYSTPAVDWSHKLVGSGDYDAENTTYTLLDYAQHNTLEYKEDDTVKVDASGALIVDNETLEMEKSMVTLPFAASDGNVIPHIKWKDDSHTKIKEEKVEQRIMELNETFSLDGNTATLSFGNLSFSKLVSTHYATWQKIMRNPIVIEEKVWLSEIDIKNLDYRKPVYLQKYGAQFIIDKVQWSEGEPSTVTLVKLPPANDIGVILPFSIKAGVAYSVGLNGSVEAVPSLSYLVSGSGEYFGSSATVRFDDQAGEKVQLKFKAWVSPTGRTISTSNPYIYKGMNGDLEIIAMTEESLIIG